MIGTRASSARCREVGQAYMALGNYIANIETDIPWLRGWLIATPVEQICTKLNQIVKESKLWDGDIANLQVANAKEDTVGIRILVSARHCSGAWDLRCEVREKLLIYIQSALASAIPHHRSLEQSAQIERNSSERNISVV
jgi:hypothetical protein